MNGFGGMVPAWLSWLVVMSLLALAIAMASIRPAVGEPPAVTLTGAWHDGCTGLSAPPAEDGGWRNFPPARMNMLAHSNGCSWVRLRSGEDGRWPTEPWVLEIPSPGMALFSLRLPDGRWLQRHVNQTAGGHWPAHGRLGFPVPGGLPADASLWLQIDAQDRIVVPVQLLASTEDAYLRRDVQALALATALLAVMLAGALATALVALRTRDRAYAWYALFVAAYMALLAVQSGYVAQPLGWSWLAGSARFFSRVTIMLAVLAALMFMEHIAQLPRYVPRLQPWLRGYAGVVLAAMVLVMLPLPWSPTIGALLVNPLLAVGSALMIGGSVVAARRGAPQARLFVLGWLPLLVVSLLSALQAQGLLVAWKGREPASLLTGAFVTLVFAHALAQRSAAWLGERDQALRLAQTDGLTGLLNRRSWDLRIGELAAAGPMTMMFIDLDHFKRVNDRLGHAVGDRCLRQLAQAIVAECDDLALAARYGGEEFVIALPGPDTAGAVALAERIRQGFARAVADLGPGQPTLSIGIAGGGDGGDVDQLHAFADQAMYRAKSGGRNRTEVHWRP